MAKFDLFRFFGKGEPSKDIAKERLKMVVLYDRCGMSVATLESIKKELTRCLDRFVEVEESGMEVQLMRIEHQRDQAGSQLVVQVPIKKVLAVAERAAK